MLKKSVIKLCGEITALSVFISDVTQHDIFTRYASHVSKFEVDVCIGGWKDDNKSNHSRTDIWIDHETAEKKLIDLKEKLETILSEIYAIKDQKREGRNN